MFWKDLYRLAFDFAAASDRGRYGGARNKMLHKINEALGKVKVGYTLPPYPATPMDRRMLQLLGTLPADVLPDTQPIPIN